MCSIRFIAILETGISVGRENAPSADGSAFIETSIAGSSSTTVVPGTADRELTSFCSTSIETFPKGQLPNPSRFICDAIGTEEEATETGFATNPGRVPWYCPLICCKGYICK